MACWRSGELGRRESEPQAKEQSVLAFGELGRRESEPQAREQGAMALE